MSTDLGLRKHVNKAGHRRRLQDGGAGQWGGGHTLYLSTPSGLAMSLAGNFAGASRTPGDYVPTVPSAPIGTGEVTLCNIGTCSATAP